MASTVFNRLQSIFKSTTTSTAAAAATTTTKLSNPGTKKPKKLTPAPAPSATTSVAATTTTTTSISDDDTTKKVSKTNSNKPKTNTPGAGASATVVSRTKRETQSFNPLPMSHLTTSLENLKFFIDRFKRASNVGPFRYSYKYYEDVVSHLSRAKQHAYIEEIIEHQKRYSTDITSEPFVVRLISLYGKSRMYDHARKLFEKMPDLNCPRTVLSANALLMACLKSKRFSEIPELFRELREGFSIEPDNVTYNIVVKAFCDMGAIDSALLAIDEMEENGCECNIYTFNTILDGLYDKGDITNADKMWEKMKSKNIDPDVRTYNAKVRGLIVDKRIQEAIDLLEEMRSKGLNPDVYTYNGLIHGFVKEDDLMEVKRIYNDMVANEIVPDSVTFRIIIPFASKKGDFRYAFELSKDGLSRKLNIGRANLQGVLDGLMKESAINEAEQLVEVVKASPSIYYKLKLPVNSNFQS